MGQAGKQWAIDLKDLFKTLIDIRNMEISLFWQRSNYFLVLNTGIALGFFNLEEARYVLVLAVMGLFASLLWFWVCLGSKYWQTRWEQRLHDFEVEYLAGLEFFAAGPERIHEDVKRGLAFRRLGWVQRTIYGLALRNKPSVSYSMTMLSGLFVLGWVALIVTFLAPGAHP